MTNYVDYKLWFLGFFASRNTKEWFKKTDWTAEVLAKFFLDEYVPGFYFADERKNYGYTSKHAMNYKRLRVIMVGHSQIGKSSLINSIISAVHGRMRYPNRPGGGNGELETQMINADNFIASGRVQFYDTPGFANWDQRGIDIVKEYVDIEGSFNLLLVVVRKDCTEKDLEEMQDKMREVRNLKLPVMLCLTKKNSLNSQEIATKLGFRNTHEVVEFENLFKNLDEIIPVKERFEILTELMKTIKFTELQIGRYWETTPVEEIVRGYWNDNQLLCIMAIIILLMGLYIKFT